MFFFSTLKSCFLKESQRTENQCDTFALISFFIFISWTGNTSSWHDQANHLAHWHILFLWQQVRGRLNGASPGMVCGYDQAFMSHCYVSALSLLQVKWTTARSWSGSATVLAKMSQTWSFFSWYEGKSYYHQGTVTVMLALNQSVTINNWNTKPSVIVKTTFLFSQEELWLLKMRRNLVLDLIYGLWKCFWPGWLDMQRRTWRWWTELLNLFC